MDKLSIRLIGKKDVNGNDYYTSTTHAPVLVDFSKSVIHVFPYQEDDDKFGAELTFRHYDQRDKLDKDGNIKDKKKDGVKDKRDELWPEHVKQRTDEEDENEG
jgi:hypothetical protein